MLAASLLTAVPTWYAPAGVVPSTRTTAAIMEVSDLSLAEKFAAEDAAAAAARASYKNMVLGDMIGAGPETGASQPWDPLNLSGEWLTGDIDKLAWMRAAEIKHGRVCMAAFVGYLVTSAGVFLPGAINFEGTQFSDLGTDPWAAWDALSYSGKQQIIGTVGLLEFISETEKPHYTAGGEPGRVKAVWRALSKLPWANPELTPAERDEKLVSELKNGRLAMIGCASLYAAHVIPGSVPLLPYVVVANL